ncbi:MAG: caspase family protein [Polymorphobacter sp.]|uniref:caspase family protein n=1 Tax=Polymorphobacter sp. TaxID=1909290 RepID=UPI003A86DA8B
MHGGLFSHHRTRHALLALALSLAAPFAAHAAPAIRGVFVGIDSYRHSRATNPYAQFDNLRGAVADAQAVKQALAAAYHLTVDAPVPGQCETANQISITLTDDCATRARILEALVGQIAASAANDTVIFFFAGHGSRIVDDQVFDQASGYNSSIMPVDARDPEATAPADILDRELRTIIDIANARGVHVVTIFDSCNSGSGARRGGPELGQERGVSGITAQAHVDYRPPLAPTGPGGGYRVHFGASRDDELAREVVAGAAVHGVFTTAFIQTLIAQPAATFGDLATAVRLKVSAAGHTSQTPQAEGALQARFGGSAINVALFDAQPSAGGITLAAGRLLGMTKGSKFALFASQADALSDTTPPLATATLTTLEDGHARLAIDEATAPLPPSLVARETHHVFGDDRLKVSLAQIHRPDQRRVAEALNALGFVEVAETNADAQFTLTNLSLRGVMQATYLYTKGGDTLALLAAVDDPEFPAQLRAALRPVYNVQRLLALPARSSADTGLSLCLSTRLDHPVQACPEPADRQRRVTLDAPLVFTLANASDTARHVHVLVIDSRYGITRLIPSGGGRDPPMAPRAVQRPGLFALNTQGQYRFVIITSDVQLNTAVLEQAPVRSKMSGPCDPEWESPGVCAQSTSSARGDAVPSLGEWTITVEDVVVEAPETGR